jgi:hypothetical protein
LCGSRISSTGDSSVTEQSTGLEDVLKSPDKEPYFRQRRKNVVPKGVGAELFGVSSVINELCDLKLPQKKATGCDCVCFYVYGCMAGGESGRCGIPFIRYVYT